jgi:two-component system, LytTR family, response regulator
MKALIVDDEALGRESLELLLKKHCPQVEIVCTAENITEARQQILSYAPAVVFLDIEMPYGNAFDLLEELGAINFEVIFVTAYESHAVKAFRYNAVDYLLKPIDPDDLKKAVARVEKKIQTSRLNSNSNTQIERLLQTLPAGRPRRLTLSTADNILFVNIDDIVRLKADTNYTYVHLLNGEKIIVSRTLKEYEGLLSDCGFFRVHNSHLVNLNHIKKYIKSDNYLEMSDSSKVEVSNRRKADFLLKLGSIMK